MSRPPRLVVPGQPLHLIQRGNNRVATFRAVHDYEWYMQALLESSSREGCAVHAYVLMQNHVHLLVTPSGEHALGRMMQAVGRRYVRYFNGRYARTGTLWEGRFRSALIDCDRYFFTCSRYIELNPVRAGIVDEPGEYRWSSFASNADGEPDALVTPYHLYNTLGARISERRAAYRGLFVQKLDEDVIVELRRATNSGGVLGEDKFRRRAEQLTGRPISRQSRGGDRRSATFKEQISTTLTPLKN